MTPQEIFDKVVTHLRKQGCKALAKTRAGKTVCHYRGDNNTACAVGCLIEDSEYRPWMEGLAAIAVLKHPEVPASLKMRLKDHTPLLARLQNVHDTVELELWEKEFQMTTERFKLKYSRAVTPIV